MAIRRWKAIITSLEGLMPWRKDKGTGVWIISRGKQEQTFKLLRYTSKHETWVITERGFPGGGLILLYQQIFRTSFPPFSGLWFQFDHKLECIFLLSFMCWFLLRRIHISIYTYLNRNNLFSIILSIISFTENRISEFITVPDNYRKLTWLP